MSRKTLGLVVLVPFVAFTSWVAYGHGALGFLTLAGEEPWALQMLLDLTISLTFVCSWMVVDARRRGVTAWPWVLATIALGSIAPLTYLVAHGSRSR